MSALLLSLWVSTVAVSPVALSSSRVTALDGTWEGRLSDEGGAGETGEWRGVQVPGNLPFQGIKYDGVLWLRQRFTVPEGAGDYAVHIPMAANAYEVFINGTLVGSRGRIGPSGELLEKDLRGQVYRLPKETLRADGPNTLALRLRTFYGNGGVMAPGVFAGPEGLVRDAHALGVAKVSMLVSLFLFAAFFHGVLFLVRTRERHYLSFAFLCTGLASITAGINTLGYLVTSNVDFNAYLVFVPLLVLPFCFVLFFSDFFGRRVLWLKRGTLAFGAAGMLCLVSSTVHHPLYPFFEGVVMPFSVLALSAALLLSVWWTVLGVKEKQFGARAIATGLVVYALTGVMELAWTFDVIHVRVDSYLGFAFFIGAMVVAIASRFAWLHRQVEAGQRDALTGCLTRHGFKERLSRSLGEPATSSCIMLDLDHFKHINDTHGHQTGDRVLMAAGHAMREVLRQTDLIARWGGEEFLVLLPDQNTQGALDIASRIQNALRAERVDDLSITASFGVATRTSGEAFDTWLERADKALYDAKQSGRDCIRAAA
jgi:diguanylate cyclase (GGDEF)-like protein